MLVVEEAIPPSESSLEFALEVRFEVYIRQLGCFPIEDHHRALEGSIVLFGLLVDRLLHPRRVLAFQSQVGLL